MSDNEIVEFLKKHLQSIQENDTKTYNETTAEDLTLYEWWITPHRIDGLPFHEFMMTSNAERGTVFGAEGKEKSSTRFDLSNLHVQRYGDTAIASYTLLISTATAMTSSTSVNPCSVTTLFVLNKSPPPLPVPCALSDACVAPLQQVCSVAGPPQRGVAPRRRTGAPHPRAPRSDRAPRRAPTMME